MVVSAISQVRSARPRRKAAVPESFSPVSRLSEHVARQSDDDVREVADRGHFFTQKLRDAELTDLKRQQCRQAALTCLLAVRNQGVLRGVPADVLQQHVGDVRAEIRAAFAEGETAHHAARREMAYVS